AFLAVSTSFYLEVREGRGIFDNIRKFLRAALRPPR
ncbi:MAG: hypothetical protein JWQ00_2025, partial [Noviherbaspirillum sp.]|nr:hypothetical protein [Noviherbaspirillum sp.]